MTRGRFVTLTAEFETLKKQFHQAKDPSTRAGLLEEISSIIEQMHQQADLILAEWESQELNGEMHTLPDQWKSAD